MQANTQKSWSSLVGNAYVNNSANPNSTNNTNSNIVNSSIQSSKTENDEKASEKLFVECLKRLTISEKSLSLTPCGLNNPDNKCFMNVVLQSMLGSSPFLNLLTLLQSAKIPQSKYPYTKKFVDLSIQYQKMGVQRNQNSFSATDFMNSLNEFYTLGTNFQEDAQEYLSFLMSKLDNELAILNAPSTITIPQEEDDPWITKGKKKNVVVLTENLIEQTTNHSIISQIFQGQIQSVVSKKGLPNSASSEPCFCIHLDILNNSVTSLESALTYFTNKENIEYFNVQNKSVPANKQTKIEKGPLNLIFHLKRFTMGNEKIYKNISYPSELTLQPQWCTANFDNGNKNYQLYSVVSHIGKETKGGHYICHTLNSQNIWFTYDDWKVTKTDLKKVLNSDSVYLLFYRRKS